MDEEFLQQFKASYNEDYIAEFMSANMVNNFMRAKDVIDYNCDDDTFMMFVYSVILSVEKNYHIEICDNVIDHRKFRLRDFIIERN